MKRSTLIHLPLEEYSNRYTSELAHWERTAFSPMFDIWTPQVEREAVTASITKGEVLDATGRPLWCLSQIQQCLHQGPNLGKVYCSDFYTPGLDALAYARFNFKAAAFCWAQTFDQYDFTRKLFINWMRPWEIMAFELYARVYVACPELKDLIITALPHVAEKVKVVGLPYNHRQVFSMLKSLPTHRQFDVVYAARWDEEKQPSQFLDLVTEGNFKGLVCTGLPTLQGTDAVAVDRALNMKNAGKLTILTGLTRSDYFFALSNSNVIFNCGLQDWVSYTLLDALTFGCQPMYPAHRSFPRALYWEESFLYPPGDINVAVQKITELVTSRPPIFGMLASRVLVDNDLALDTIAQDLQSL